MNRYPELTLEQYAILATRFGLFTASTVVAVTIIRLVVLAIIRTVSHA